MEDALAQNGNISQTAPVDNVLILVLMEDALARVQFERDGETRTVLILVLMEDALAPREVGRNGYYPGS